MISKKDIIAVARSITKRSRGARAPRPVYPVREWLIGVTVFIGLTTVGGILSAQSYVYYSNLESTVTDTSRTIRPYNAAMAETAISQYRLKQEQFSKMTETATPVFFQTLEATSTESSLTNEIERQDNL